PHARSKSFGKSRRPLLLDESGSGRTLVGLSSSGGRLRFGLGVALALAGLRFAGLLFAGLAFAVFRSGCLRFRILRIARLAARIGTGFRSALAVIGDVPARALKLECRSRKQLLQCSAAALMLDKRRIGKLPDHFDLLLTLGAAVFVQRHDRCLLFLRQRERA